MDQTEGLAVEVPEEAEAWSAWARAEKKMLEKRSLR